MLGFSVIDPTSRVKEWLIRVIFGYDHLTDYVCHVQLWSECEVPNWIHAEDGNLYPTRFLQFVSAVFLSLWLTCIFLFLREKEPTKMLGTSWRLVVFNVSKLPVILLAKDKSDIQLSTKISELLFLLLI